MIDTVPEAAQVESVREREQSESNVGEGAQSPERASKGED
jgi:hypothetical protein